MIINVDSSYHHGEFAVSTVCFEDGKTSAYFIPKTFKLNGATLEVNQVIGEFYGVYMACILAPNDEHVIIYCDNITVVDVLNKNSHPKNQQMSLLYSYVMPVIMMKNIEIRYTERANNSKANYISITLLRKIRDKFKENK
jgi:hypothetical protein